MIRLIATLALALILQGCDDLFGYEDCGDAMRGVENSMGTRYTITNYDRDDFHTEIWFYDATNVQYSFTWADDMDCSTDRIKYGF